MRRSSALLALSLLAFINSAALAQAPNEATKALVGTWEFSNADRDRLCTITFRAETNAAGMRLEFDRACAVLFPFIRDIAGWTIAEGDFLRLVGSSGKPVLEFSEVESGVYEAPRPGEGILFIQNAGAAGSAPRSAGATTCTLTLTNTAAGADFVLQVKPSCDALVTRFAPVTWRIERDELALKSARGQTWRFEESDATTWRRIPQTADPVLLVRK